ncbi:hypothetical protein BDQ12DRAFT_684071 [Crucibulum laeve]|uniref:GRIP domain-containing protein n=1 Tax=Crucibulum laeve TaxID=68775 RepID=A0A5C3LYE9_9AGAR|nr:hypothetical protein BDQ12DRAFT_684071 [Crucibulum laeve]
MATNGGESPSGSDSPSRSVSPNTSQATSTLHNLRLSIDSDRGSGASSPAEQNGVNGHSHEHKDDSNDPIVTLQRELDRTRQEKDALASQYNNLLAKLTQMRTTLGNKLKQDAEELDRQEQLLQQLTAQNEDLTSTVETLKEELIASHKEADRASSELDSMRNRVLQESAQENQIHERELRETQTELERCKMERDEWERIAMQERAISEDVKSTLETLSRDLELEREARDREMGELDAEREKAENLQAVLRDFQSARDHELRQAVKDYESQLMQVTQSLAEFKHRALTAELQLEESHMNVTRTSELEKEVKEKNLLIGKLRHEAVIMNEHLMEALRRLRRNSSDTNVDRRLVTNVLLSFLTTPRADGKRFEMLNLLSSILSWNDSEREKAGLQRNHTPAPTSFWGRTSSAANSPSKNHELDKSDETESFSRLWVEFLLTEAAAGESPSISEAPTPSRNNNSLPGTPTNGAFPSSPTFKGQRRLASMNQSAAMASSPNLLQPPTRKGKEKDRTPDS